jgi:hypothetical protein
MKIHKYTLKIGEPISITVSRGLKPLTVQLQDNNIVMWAEVPNYFSETCERLVWCIHTGKNVPEEPNEYVGTVQRYDLVYHVYLGAEV